MRTRTHGTTRAIEKKRESSKRSESQEGTNFKWFGLIAGTIDRCKEQELWVLETGEIAWDMATTAGDKGNRAE